MEGGKGGGAGQINLDSEALSYPRTHTGLHRSMKSGLVWGPEVRNFTLPSGGGGGCKHMETRTSKRSRIVEN